MGYTVETMAGKNGPINRVPATPRVRAENPGGKRTVNDHDGGSGARAVISTNGALKVARAVKI